MTDEWSTGASGRPRVRVKTRRRSQSHKNPVVRWLRDARAPRVTMLTMVAVTIAYFGAILWQTRLGALVYNGIVVGSAAADVRYIIGPPKAREDGDAVWIYPAGENSDLRISFADGSAQSISCSDPGISGACAGTMGLGMGSTEERVLQRLGAPARQRYIGDAKVIEYPGLGLSFELRQFRIHRITLSTRPDRFSYLGYVPRIAVP